METGSDNEHLTVIIAAFSSVTLSEKDWHVDREAHSKSRHGLHQPTSGQGLVNVLGEDE